MAPSGCRRSSQWRQADYCLVDRTGYVPTSPHFPHLVIRCHDAIFFYIAGPLLNVVQRTIDPNRRSDLMLPTTHLPALNLQEVDIVRAFERSIALCPSSYRASYRSHIHKSYSDILGENRALKSENDSDVL
jgi:hypothetical protein